jgi:hypothetical protein
MLRRAAVTIYMAQKIDTFGKDSEASVALGQGKPVIVYAPKLILPGGAYDAETLFRQDRVVLMGLLDENERRDIDDTVDHEAVVAKVLTAKLEKATGGELSNMAATHWADA